MNCSRIGCSYEAFKVWLKYLQLSSGSKQRFCCRSFKISNHRRFMMNPWFCRSDYSFFSKLVGNLFAESLINPKFPVIANFQRSTGEFFCWQKRNEGISARQLCKCFIWVTNIWTNHEEVLPNFFCLDRPLKFNHFFQWWRAFELHNAKPTESNQKNYANQLISDKFVNYMCAYHWSLHEL